MQSQIRIPDHFSTSLTVVVWGILGDLVAFSYSHRPMFTTLGQMTDVDKVMNPQHFWSNLTNSWLQIQPNWSGNPDQFQLRLLDALAEICSLRSQSSFRCWSVQVIWTTVLTWAIQAQSLSLFGDITPMHARNISTASPLEDCKRPFGRLQIMWMKTVVADLQPHVQAGAAWGNQRSSIWTV